MHSLQNRAAGIISSWKSESYKFGLGADRFLPRLIADAGMRVHLVTGATVAARGLRDDLVRRLSAEGVCVVGESRGAAENSPIGDVGRVKKDLLVSKPDVVVSYGGGSLIDAVKASIVLACCGGTVEQYFGIGRVSACLERRGGKLLPHVAVMTAGASAAHLTKYSNVTNLATSQKKLIIDPAIVPGGALFDYGVTVSMPQRFTAIGAWDGIGHLSEVYYGFPSDDQRFARLEEAVYCGLGLAVEALPRVLLAPNDMQARIALGLSTDLGGFAIMTGSTNGPHLNSFSLVDIAEHGCAVGILQAYYGCFFAPAIPEKIRGLLRVYERHGCCDPGVDPGSLAGRSLGLAYGSALRRFAKQAGLPLSLGALKGFGPEHIERMVSAAKAPELSSKLEAMPLPMNADDVERFMRPILVAAASGDLEAVPDVSRVIERG